MAKHLVKVRIDKHIKEEAAEVLATMGLTTSDAIRLLLTRVATEGALPFSLYEPNQETIAAMSEARGAGLKKFDRV